MCNPQTLSDLKDSIKRDNANIRHAISRTALLSTASRVQWVRTCDGIHVENA